MSNNWRQYLDEDYDDYPKVERIPQKPKRKEDPKKSPRRLDEEK
jgi:hypothetical protein